MDDKQNYCTIRQAAKLGIMPENSIRGLVKLNLCPGFHIGTRFYVDVEGLRELLKKMSNKNENIESYR
jgi:hypothetical protein